MTGHPTGAGDGTISWRELVTETTGVLTEVAGSQAALEARWIVEEASGLDGAAWVLGAEEPATVRGVAAVDAMTARRRAGEPIQYVLGHWAFRSLDLLCDRRVLIPRPETEQVAEVALAQLDAIVATRVGHRNPVVVDLGTGSGALALAIATERPRAEVFATDVSPDALAVARANLGALGMAGRRVRLHEGSWFEALPSELAGQVDLLVSNPPYIAAHEPLDASVTDWEPVGALVPGPSGLEAYEEILGAALGWLAPGGAVVLEIGHTQASAVTALATAAGLAAPSVHPDLAGLDRTVVAHRPA